MQTASIFLLPNGTFIVELVIFLVILFLIAKFILPPLNRAMERRQEEIRTSLEAAETAKADAAAADDERRAALTEARQQAREILAQANRTAEQISVDARARAESEYERVLAAAEADVELARQRALEEAASRLGELVVDVVERIIGREVSAEAHRDLIDEAVTAIDHSASSSGASASGVSTG
jgi:F-type H+-transporting ATPase subunit b